MCPLKPTPPENRIIHGSGGGEVLLPVVALFLIWALLFS